MRMVHRTVSQMRGKRKKGGGDWPEIETRD